MAVNKDAQAAFIEAMDSLKEYAKVNGGIVTKEDVLSFFKGMDIDDSKLQMIFGYLMANNIKVNGETQVDNSFLRMMENAVEQDEIREADDLAKGVDDASMDAENRVETSGSIEHAVNANDNQISGQYASTQFTSEQNASGILKQSNKKDNLTPDGIAGISYDSEDEEQDSVEEKQRLNHVMDDHLNYEEDDKFIELYKEDLKSIEKLSDQTRAMLLINIVEDNDKESLQLLSQSFLEEIMKWIEPFCKQGVLASDLIQESNLAMMAYMSEKRFLHNYEWKDKIKEGTTDDVLEVLKAIQNDVKAEVEGSLRMLIDEQYDSAKVSQKVLNKVNLINDWAKRLRQELGRKPTVAELAEKIGFSEDNIQEAIQLSAEAIEDIDLQKSKEDGNE